MPKKSFIFQGIRGETHAEAIARLLLKPDSDLVIMSFAFVNKSGVELLANEIKSVEDRLRVYAGIRNDITTIQGMKALQGTGAKLYAFDTGSRHVIFHPKLCLVRFANCAELIIGSANLTLGGLNNNVEAGIQFSFDLAKKSDRRIVDAIIDDFDKLPTDHPKNVTRIATSIELDVMLSQGRLVDESATPAPRPRATSAPGAPADGVPRIKLKVQPIRTKVPKAAKSKALAVGKKGSLTAGAAAGAPTPGSILELVWESKALTRRDLTIPNTLGTNPTGSMNLDKGLLEASVDHRHYFRDIVFSALKWSTRSATVDEAVATFRLVVKGVAKGEFELAIRHTTSTTTKAYKQKNAMTRLSWAAAHDTVAKSDNIGRNLSLYRDKADPSRFVLEID